MGHGQYLVYSSKSSIFEECIIVFQVLVYKQMLSFFEECIIVFQAPAQFPKKTVVTTGDPPWLKKTPNRPDCLMARKPDPAHLKGFQLCQWPFSEACCVYAAQDLRRAGHGGFSQQKRDWSVKRYDLIINNMAVCQNLVPLVNIKIAGKWMFIPLKMVLIGIDPYPYGFIFGLSEKNNPVINSLIIT